MARKSELSATSVYFYVYLYTINESQQRRWKENVLDNVLLTAVFIVVVLLLPALATYHAVCGLIVDKFLNLMQFF